ncbi:hypothetical protein RFI_22459 [Reticulomyxa filosa]|uniref:Non-specific serine/threonine protein kinase n=1 Tax=Reticulomyxa filosa TaxID=46433 RepID=X6MM60_RETFI|nr:hypothetical protein RFI_22459 [Reticulomyxa filosa]|eukprot:ETO14909.1 hypothetical protein RFI_22459 [Reticulomyxa filosa]
MLIDIYVMALLFWLARYASLSNHRGIHQTRRDDLESVAYMLIYFLKGELPWQGLRENDRVKKWRRIEQKKASFSAQQLTQGLPHEFCFFLEYTKKLKYDETPNYERLRTVLNKLYRNCGFQKDHTVDWMYGQTSVSSTESIDLNQNENNAAAADNTTNNANNRSEPFQS